MNYKIIDIEGIGPSHAHRLSRLQIIDTKSLLDTAAGPAGRDRVATGCGVPTRTVLGWVNKADLMRIKGIGSEYADLLEAAGVETVLELRHQDPAALASGLAEANEVRRLTRRVPSAKVVGRWVASANALEPVVTH